MSKLNDLHEYKDVLVSGVEYDFSRDRHEKIPHRLYADWAVLVIKLAQAVHRSFIAPPFPESLEFQTKSILSDAPNISLLDHVYAKLMAVNGGGLYISFENGRRGDDDPVRMYTLGFQPRVYSEIPKAARAPLANVQVRHREEQSSEIEEIIARHRQACLAGAIEYPTPDEPNDLDKCALCGDLPDDFIVNTGRDNYFLDPTYQLTRRVFGDITDERRRCPRCGAEFRWIDMPQLYGSGNNDEERFIRLPEKYYPVKSSSNDDSRDALKRAAELEAARAQHSFSILEKHFASAGVVVKHSGPPKDWSHFCLLFYLNINGLSLNGIRHAKLVVELLAELVAFIEAFSGEKFTKNLYDMLIYFNARCPWLEPFLPASARYKISEMEEMRSRYEDEAERFRLGQMSY